MQYAEDLVCFDHRRTPGFLALLALAYHQNHQPDNAAACSKEDLCLLPLPPPAFIQSTQKNSRAL